jgi:hypothetical protein
MRCWCARCKVLVPPVHLERWVTGESGEGIVRGACAICGGATGEIGMYVSYAADAAVSHQPSASGLHDRGGTTGQTGHDGTSTHTLSRRREQMLLHAAAALSLLAALIHTWVINEHYAEWWGYGLFSFCVGSMQACYAGTLLLWPRRLIYGLGIAGNVVIILLYIVTRTMGIPFFGPDAGMVEQMGTLDLFCTYVELALVLALVALASSWRWRAAGSRLPVRRVDGVARGRERDHATLHRP